MRGKQGRHLRRCLWGFVGVAVAAAVGLPFVLPFSHGQTPPAGPPPPPVEPSAAIIDEYRAQIRAGTAASRANRYAEATQAFEAASRLQPSEHLPYRALAELYWREGRHAEASQAVRSLAVAIPEAYYLDQIGRTYEESGLRELARRVYEEAVRVDPQFPGAHYNLGRACLEGGDLERGIAEMQETLRLHPDFPEAHQALGMAFTEQERFERAIAHLERALALDPDLMLVRNHLGRIYMLQGQLDQAIQTFRSLVERFPDVAEARHNLAVAYARKRLQEQAIEQFDEALRLRPVFHAARMDLATLLLEMRRPQDAIDTLRPALLAAAQSGGPSDQAGLVELRYGLSIAYWMLGQPQEAIQELEVVLRVQPAHGSAHAYLSRLYYETRHFDRAWKHARQAEALGVPVAELIAALRRISVEPP